MREDADPIALRVVDALDVLVAYWDRDLRCRFANAAYLVWFGRTPQQMLGMPMSELLGPLYPLNLPHIEAALNGQTQVFEREIPLPDGSVRYSLASYYPDIASGVVRGFSVQVTDVTRLKRLEFELKEAKQLAESLATQDFLTELPNRRFLMERLDSEISRARRNGQMLGVAVIDLDGFKQINDTYGHSVGDAVLKGIAERMRSTLRDTDIVARIGGDEFVFLASDVQCPDAFQQAVSRLKDRVCQSMKVGDISVIPGLSSGISIFPKDGQTAPELLTFADQELYQTKRKVRQRLILTC